ncbi:hypothetical protein B0J18DRAFT_58831 [Chaetomium sp. MPI-SDFR-AT-0129]|nr:hypothetical protein B0J18DRAFT_58831 [Chaetomium sp. MPI-SDFR-AT-0129]
MKALACLSMTLIALPARALAGPDDHVERSVVALDSVLGSTAAVWSDGKEPPDTIDDSLPTTHESDATPPSAPVPAPGLDVLAPIIDASDPGTDAAAVVNPGVDFLDSDSDSFTFGVPVPSVTEWYSRVDATSFVLVSSQVPDYKTISISATDTAQASRIWEWISASTGSAVPTEACESSSFLPETLSPEGSFDPVPAPASADIIGSFDPTVDPVPTSTPASSDPVVAPSFSDVVGTVDPTLASSFYDEPEPTTKPVVSYTKAPAPTVVAGAGRSRSVGGLAAVLVAGLLGAILPM